MQIIILGMHRSGTSLVARTLNLMGAYLGPEGTMMPATDDNPKGYWERLDVVLLNEWLLQSSGFSWDKVFDFDVKNIDNKLLDEFNDKAKKIISDMDMYRPWVLKDPRLCLLFPLWRELLDVPVCIQTYRSPIQVARSLRSRDNFPLPYGIALWQKYQYEAIRSSIGLPGATVSYEELVSDPILTVKKLYDSLELLEVQGLRLPSNKEITSFIDPKLHHEKSSSSLENAFLTKDQRNLIRFIQEGDTSDNDDLVPSVAPEFLTILDDYECLIEGRRTQKELKSKLANTEAELESLQLSFVDQAEKIRNQAEELRNQEASLVILQNTLKDRDNTINDQGNIIKDRDNTINKLNEDAQARITDLQNNLNDKQGVLDNYHSLLDRKTNDLFLLEQQTNSIKDKLAEKISNIDRLTHFIDSIQEELQLYKNNTVELKEQRRKDGIRTNELINYFETLSHDIQAVFDSYTWKIGSFFAGLFKIVVLKWHDATAYDHIAEVKKNYFGWKANHIQNKGSKQPNARSANVTDKLRISSITPVATSSDLNIGSSHFSSELEKSVNSFEEAYLSQNPDIQLNIINGELVSAKQHWNKYGKYEVEKGLRKFVPDVFLGNIFSPHFGAEYRKKLHNIISDWENKPFISVVMPVYNVKRQWLDEAVNSVVNQTYSNWELCIADDNSSLEETINYLKGISDTRIKIRFLEKNSGISQASNVALSMAKGDYIALLDNDDLLTENALFEVAKAIRSNSPDLIYSDEDKITTKGSHTEPHFKPDYSPDLLSSINYLCHLCVFKKTLCDEIGGFRDGFQGSQDYDLMLRIIEKAQSVFHIPKILYHWRKTPNSTASVFDNKSYAWEAGQKALAESLVRRGIDGSAEKGIYPGTYRLKYSIQGEPLVSIVIPFKDKPELLKSCIDSILELSTYNNFEILGISNNSSEPEVFELMEYYKSIDKRIIFKEYNKIYNFSAINNYAVKHAHGKHLILLNNDVVVISPGWIEALLEHSQRREIGAVGAKLYYPDHQIQHAGIIIGILGLAGHSHKYFPKSSPGYFSRLNLVQNVSAVTGACLMVKKDLYESIGGLNEENLAIAFNDVDFCLRLREIGLLNIFTPYCELYHYESKSRGLEDTPEKQKRFSREADYIRKRHSELLSRGDPYYNKNLTLEAENYEVDFDRIRNNLLSDL